MKRILVIGGIHLAYHVAHLNDKTKFKAELLKPRQALERVGHGPAYDAIVVPLYLNHGAELSAIETQHCFVTGAILVKKMSASCPETVFILLNGSNQQLIREEGNVVFLPQQEAFSPSQLEDRVNDILRVKVAA